MSSTYSPDLRIQLMGPGDQAGTWGNTTNTNLGGIIENCIAGVQAVTVNSTAQGLTYLYGAVDQAQGAVIELITGSVSSAFSIFTPTAASKMYVVNNQTSWTATFYVSTVLGNTTPAGTGVAIPAGQTATIWTDGTNFYVQNSYFPGAISTGGALTVNGSVTASNHIGAGTGLTGTAASLSIGGNAATATSATTAGACTGNAATATNPASGGSFITSSNIGGQSVSYASSAGSASTATTASNVSGGYVSSVNGAQGAVTIGPPVTLYAIGTYVVGRTADVTSYAISATLAGTTLLQVPPSLNWVAGSNFSVYNTYGPYTGVAPGVGSWICISAAPGNGSNVGISGLWLRYA